MTSEAQAEAETTPEATAEPPRIWQPSRKAQHSLNPSGDDDPPLVIERTEEGGAIAVFLRYLKRPFVKLVFGLGLFILGAIVYDATVNFGSWTERAAKPKPTPHKGAEPVPQTPYD